MINPFVAVLCYSRTIMVWFGFGHIKRCILHRYHYVIRLILCNVIMPCRCTNISYSTLHHMVRYTIYVTYERDECVNMCFQCSWCWQVARAANSTLEWFVLVEQRSSLIHTSRSPRRPTARNKNIYWTIHALCTRYSTILSVHLLDDAVKCSAIRMITWRWSCNASTRRDCARTWTSY